RMQRLLEQLGHPERKLPPVIHVAGTNGKGSTIAYLRAILEAAGLRVHAYTSPYLVRINECFRLGGVLVSDDELRLALEHCERGRLVYQDDRGLMDLAAPNLFGRHQFDNAGLAIATLRAIETFKVSSAAFEAGIVNAEWPARMQRLSSGVLADQGPPGCEIWLDGGHNAAGGRVAAAALGDLEERVSRPLVIIAGMMANKDANAFLANF